MKRREFVKTASLAALSATALAACEKQPLQHSPQAPALRANKTFKWKMVTAWPKNFPGLGTGANYLAETITAMSGGRLEVKVYGAGELVPAFEAFDAVSKGTAEMGHAGAYYWKGKSEATQFFTTVPFGLTSQETLGWLKFGGGQELWDELYAPFNLKPFPAGSTGVQMGGWFNKEINQIEDFKGLKMRMPGLGGEVLQRVGGTVVNLPGGELFQAMQNGTLDATEWVGPYNDLAFGLHKVGKYYYWPGWHEPGSIMECFVNQKALAGLPQDLAAIVTHAMDAAYEQMSAEFTARNNRALTTLLTKHKVQLRHFSKDILTTLAKISQEVIEEMIERDPFSKRVYQSYSQFRKESMQWNQIGELGYAQARALVF